MKFGTEERGQFTKMVSRRQSNGLWKKMCMSKRKFDNYISWWIGTGARVRLWHETWMKSGTLRV